jgi:hypothetical protein
MGGSPGLEGSACRLPAGKSKVLGAIISIFHPSAKNNLYTLLLIAVKQACDITNKSIKV